MRFVLFVGDVSQGINVFGPFDSKEEIVAWVEDRPTLLDTTIVPIRDPAAFDRSLQCAIQYRKSRAKEQCEVIKPKVRPSGHVERTYFE